jgi:DNA-binding XRE family transcriptional regulator
MAKKPGMKPPELKEARARLGLTQEQLATGLDVHRLTVIRWEAGMHKIPHMLELAIKELEREHSLARDENAPTENPSCLAVRR